MTEQVNAIHAAFKGNNSLTVEAGAGCGKTTLIVTGNQYLPYSTLFLSFNKDIADELKKRMPMRMCGTFHATALRNLTSRIGKLPIDAYKYSRLASKQYGLDRDDANCVSQIISDFQMNVEPIFFDPKEWTPEYCISLMSQHFQFELDIADQDTFYTRVDQAMELLCQEINKPTALSFDDMLFFLAFYQKKKRWNLCDYDCVVVDEAQDVSPIRMHLISLFSKRLIQVGDRRQAIYAFAGAMTNAMDQMSERFNCVEYPLSVTWRCATSIIEEASTIVGDFLQARPDAPTGQVGYMREVELLNSTLDNSTMVVCRMNAPRISLALKLLKRRVPFNLRSDFPERLIKKVKRLASNLHGLASLRTALREHYDEKIEGAGDNAQLIHRITDERDTLIEISNDCDSIDDLLMTLEDLAKSKYGVVLSTGHKAKGLEAENVMILRPDLTPAPWIDPVEKPEQYQQELNLKYVMITRAKTNLFYVEKD